VESKYGPENLDPPGRSRLHRFAPVAPPLRGEGGYSRRTACSPAPQKFWRISSLSRDAFHQHGEVSGPFNMPPSSFAECIRARPASRTASTKRTYEQNNPDRRHKADRHVDGKPLHAERRGGGYSGILGDDSSGAAGNRTPPSAPVNSGVKAAGKRMPTTAPVSVSCFGT
jgi:hypothetical protein